MMTWMIERLPESSGVSREGSGSAPLRAPFLAMTYFFFRGTFAPFLRASDRPIAIACSLLLTRPPFPPLPDFSVPCFLRRIALSTLFPAALPYFAIERSLMVYCVILNTLFRSRRCSLDECGRGLHRFLGNFLTHVRPALKPR